MTNMTNKTFYVCFGNTSRITITETEKWVFKNNKKHVYNIPLYEHIFDNYFRKTRRLTTDEISDNIEQFIDFSRNHLYDNFFILFDESLNDLPDKEFLLSLFEDVINNCTFEYKFEKYLKNVKTSKRY